VVSAMAAGLVYLLWQIRPERSSARESIERIP
jgi:hypothetical protein